MIEGIVGLPGNGKSLFATLLMEQAAKSGRRVLANFPTEFSEFALWEDMVEADNCDCFIDEAQMWFSARNWTRTTQIELGVFQQHRKNGMNMYWIAQHENRVDVAMREITAYYNRVRKFGDFILVSRFTPDDAKTCMGRRLFFGPRLYDRYDTKTIIGAKDGEGYKAGRSAAYGVAGDLTAENHRIIGGKLFLRVDDGVGQICYRLPKDVDAMSAVNRDAEQRLQMSDSVLYPVFSVVDNPAWRLRQQDAINRAKSGH